MDSHHPDLAQVRALLRRPATVAELPVLEAAAAGRWSSGGVTKGRSALRTFAVGMALCVTLAAAPLLVLVAIGAWASMP